MYFGQASSGKSSRGAVPSQSLHRQRPRKDQFESAYKGQDESVYALNPDP